ncbi:MAG: CoA-binding protein, partial [Akkermansia sp.]|nr:CoA-binding protein [Akkermansia sp.]
MLDKSYAIRKMLNPTSIAVIGASEKAGKQGNSVIKYLKRYGFEGNVYPVNPKAAEIEGFTCYKSVTDIPGEVDLAIISLPNRLVPQAARECIAKGIKSAVVWSAGFGELKSEEGKRLDAELRAVCSEGGLCICGPNSLGVIDAHRAAVASFTTALSNVKQLRKGNVAFISQSGGTVAAILDEIERGGIGFSKFISTGNELNLTFSDYALELLQDDTVDIIVGYVEGIRDGKGFLKAGRLARKLGKHIILVKGGRSGAAADAVCSHTGAIAGSDGIYTAAFREVGIIQAQSTEEMMDMVFALSGQNLSPDQFGRRALVLCTGGGSGIQALDAIERSSLKPANLSPESIEKIKAVVPEFAGVTSHMIDVTPQMLMDPNYLRHFGEVLQIIEEDPGVDVTMFVQASSAPSAPAVCESIVNHRKTAKKPIVLTWWALPDVARELLDAANIYVFPSQARAINFMSALAEYCDIKEGIRERKVPEHEILGIAWPMPDVSAGPVVLTEDKVSPWLADYNIGNASAMIAKD